MRILGLDIAGSTGYALLEDNKLIEYGIIKLNPKKETSYRDRLYILCSELGNLMDKYSPDLVVIEELHNLRNAKTTVLLGMYAGVAINCIPRHIPVQTVNAISARYKTLGHLHRKIGKEEVFNWATKMFKLKLSFKQSNDITDAILIAYYQSTLTNQ